MYSADDKQIFSLSQYITNKIYVNRAQRSDKNAIYGVISVNNWHTSQFFSHQRA